MVACSDFLLFAFSDALLKINVEEGKEEFVLNSIGMRIEVSIRRAGVNIEDSSIKPPREHQKEKRTSKEERLKKNDTRNK